MSHETWEDSQAWPDLRPFVGREAHLAWLDAQLRRPRNAGCSVLAITGGPGIGKTRLLVELRRRATTAGWPVLTEATDGDHRFTAVAGPVGIRPDPDAATVRDRAARLTRAAPGVLILDDAHRADDELVDVLQLLLHECPARLVVLLAYRPRQAAGRFAAAMGRAMAAGSMTHAPLAGLSDADCARLLGRKDGDHVATRVNRMTDGNPLLALTLDGVERVPGPLPAEALAAAYTEIGDLPEQVRTVAHAAALLAEPVAPGLLAPVADVPDAVAVAAINQLVVADVLRSGEGGGLAFRHPLLRAAAARFAAAGWRWRAHGRALELLTTRKAPAAELAPHIVQVSMVGDDRAVRTLTRAANRAGSRAADSDLFLAAVGLLPADHRHTVRRGRLLLSLAESRLVEGALAAGESAATEAHLLLRLRARPVRRRAVLVGATTRALQGRWAESIAMLGRAVAADPDDRRAALSLAAFMLLHDPEAIPPALGPRPGDEPGGRAVAAGLAAFTQAGRCAAADAAAAARAAVAEFDRAPDTELEQLALPALFLTWADLRLGRYATTLSIQRRMVAVCATAGLRHEQGLWAAAHAETLRRLGRLAEAAAHADVAVELLAPFAESALAPLARSTRCLVAVDEGDLVVVARHLAEPSGPGYEPAKLVEGVMWIATTEATLLSGRTTHLESPPSIGPDGVAIGSELMVRVALAAGRNEAARRAADRAIGLTDPLPASADRAALAVARAELATGDPADAVRWAQRAVLTGDAAGHRIDGARARVVLAKAMAATGARAGAVERLREASDTATACGAGHLHAEVTQQIRRLGHRVAMAGQRGAGTGPASLSRRERQIAELVADGHTNKAIAGRLHLSEKTVERHVSAAFVKLNVPGRVALAQVLARRHDDTAAGSNQGADSPPGNSARELTPSLR